MMKHAPAMSPEDKQDKVFRVFENIAKGYDRANVRISLGMQDSWKKMLIRELTRSTPASRGCHTMNAAGQSPEQGTSRLVLRKLELTIRSPSWIFLLPCFGSQPAKPDGAVCAASPGEKEMPWKFLAAMHLLTP